jgi:hypothetical protein
MIIINSTSVGEIIIPFIDSFEVSLSAIISRYTRDNNQENTVDTVSQGAAKKPKQLRFTGMLTNNNADGSQEQINIEQTRQRLENLHESNEIVSITFGICNEEFTDKTAPSVWQSCSIESLTITSDPTSGANYHIQGTIVEDILVDTVYNRDIINVPPAKKVDDRQKKSVAPENKGYVTPQYFDKSEIHHGWLKLLTPS